MQAEFNRSSYLDEAVNEMLNDPDFSWNAADKPTQYAQHHAHFKDQEDKFQREHLTNQLAQEHMSRAKQMQDEGKPKEALNAYLKAIKEDKYCIEAYPVVSKIFVEEGKFVEAIKICGQALSVFRNYARVYFTMAQAYHGQGDLEKAIKYMELSIQYVDHFNPNARALLEKWQKEKTRVKTAIKV